MAIRTSLVPGAGGVSTQFTRTALVPGAGAIAGTAAPSPSMAATLSGVDTITGALNTEARATLSGVNTLTAALTPPAQTSLIPGAGVVSSVYARTALIPGSGAAFTQPKSRPPSESMVATLFGTASIAAILSGGVALGGFTPPASDDYMAAATRFSPPSISGTAFVPARVCLISRLVSGSPRYDCSSYRFHFANWYMNADGSGTENNPGNSVTIDGAFVELSGSFYRVTFGGQNSITLLDGQDIWSDDVVDSGTGLPLVIPANSIFYVRSAWTHPVGGNTCGGYRLDTSQAPSLGVNNEWYSYSDAPQLSFLSSGTPSSIFNAGGASGTGIRGPSGGVAKGWDGTTPVVLPLGDSLGTGANDSVFTNGLDSRGNAGYMKRGLDENSSSTRMAYMNLCLSGSKPSQITSLTKRLAMLAALPNIPYTCVWSEMGVNSVGGTFSSFQTVMRNWWSFVRTNFCPNGQKLIQSTLSPKTTTADTYFWTDTAHQTPFSAADIYPTGVRWLMNDYIRAGALSERRIDAIVDVTPFMIAAGTNDLWNVSTFTASLVNDMTAGAKTNIVLDASPPLGALIVYEPGTANAETGPEVNSITGSGPFTVGSDTPSLTHAAGSTVMIAFNSDTTHPIKGGHLNVVNGAVIPAKIAGVFGSIAAGSLPLGTEGFRHNVGRLMQ